MYEAPGALPRRQAIRRRKRKPDENLLRAIEAIIPKDQAIVDLGAGIGIYTKALRDLGYKADGYDGTEDIEALTDEMVKWCDLTKDVSYLLINKDTMKPGSFVWPPITRYDWGLFLEVGEHVPAELETKLIRNVCSIPREGLIVTWSDSTRGYKHVNPRIPLYVASQFALRNMVVNEELTLKAQSMVGRRLARRLMVLKYD
jgi:2-polyprenyl-3-methyl-5-hydroxy-6-metoxy-1,4-benzoquinol methylase